MKRTTNVILTSLVFAASISIGAYALYTSSSPTPARRLRGLYTNESYITGLYRNMDLNNPFEVFEYIFDNLEDEVTVYPSENYYYFAFTGRGYYVTGSLLLSAEEAEQKGKIGLGYAVKPEERSRQKYFRIRGGHHEFTAEDSVYVNRVNDFKYTVTYRGRTVTFNFFDGGNKPPRKAKLTPNEVYVGQQFDESGLRFYLIFNKKVKRVYWVLNEDSFVPEEFRRYSSDVVLGTRTDYAFYEDTANSRKILIGVDGLNVLNNNWFDGPFDQMPDNYVKSGRITVKPYLVESYKLEEREIDKYGKFTGRQDARLPVAPYTVLFGKDDLYFVDSLKRLPISIDQFYGAIAEQVYQVPKGFYDGVRAK